MAGKPQFDFYDVLDRAADQFRLHGYAGTSVDDLVQVTGLSRSSVYHHFGDKDGLFEAALARYRQRTREQTAPAAPLADPRAGLVELLGGVAKRLTGKGARPGCMLVASCSELDDLPASAAESVRAGFAEQREQIEALLKAGVKAGQLPAKTDIKALSQYFLGVRQGLVILARAGAKRAELDALITTALIAWDHPQTR